MAFPLVSLLFWGVEYDRPSLNPFVFRRKFFASCIYIYSIYVLVAKSENRAIQSNWIEFWSLTGSQGWRCCNWELQELGKILYDLMFGGDCMSFNYLLCWTDIVQPCPAVRSAAVKSLGCHPAPFTTSFCTLWLAAGLRTAGAFYTTRLEGEGMSSAASFSHITYPPITHTLSGCRNEGSGE